MRKRSSRQQEQREVLKEEAIDNFFSGNDQVSNLLLATQLYLMQKTKRIEVIEEFKKHIEKILNPLKFPGKTALQKQLDLISSTIVNTLIAKKQVFLTECRIDFLDIMGLDSFSKGEEVKSKVIERITQPKMVKRYYKNYQPTILNDTLNKISVMSGIVGSGGFPYEIVLAVGVILSFGIALYVIFQCVMSQFKEFNLTNIVFSLFALLAVVAFNVIINRMLMPKTPVSGAALRSINYVSRRDFPRGSIFLGSFILSFGIAFYAIAQCKEFNLANIIFSLIFLLIAAAFNLVLSGKLIPKWYPQFIQASRKGLEAKTNENSLSISSQLKKIQLKKISVTDFSEKDTPVQTVYIPFFSTEPKLNETVSEPFYPTTSTRQKRKKVKKVKPKQEMEHSANKFTKPIQSLPSVFKWLGEKLINFPEKEVTSNHKWVRPMTSDSLPPKTYFAFFNKNQLREIKNTDPQSYKNYQDRCDRGFIVGPKGETGIKRLNSPYVAAINGKCRIFSFELKTVGTKSRCLGYEIADEQGRHKLVDFCLHLPEGLH